MDTKLHKPRKSSVFNRYTNCLSSSFKLDAEAFLQKFQQENTLNYAEFANIWQSMNFTFVFADQQAVKNLENLSEICFTIVKKHLMFESSIYKQIGSFYLLYGLYYKQPIQNLMKIRLTLEEYKHVKKLMNEMLTRGQYDAIYIFSKMKADGAFIYVAQSTPLKISGVSTKANEQNMNDLDDTFHCKDYESSLYKFENILKDETVQALDKTAKEYEAKLKLLAMQRPGLVPFKTTIIRDLEEAYQKVFTKRTTSSEQNEEEQQPETVYMTRHRIKSKAMANKHAEYRGSRKVLTAADIEKESESD